MKMENITCKGPTTDPNRKYSGTISYYWFLNEIIYFSPECEHTTEKIYMHVKMKTSPFA